MVARYNQTNHLLRLNTSLGPQDTLIPSLMHADFTMSEGFGISLTAFSETHHDIKPKDLVGTPATIGLVQKDNSLRYINGYINALEALGSNRGGELSEYRLEIVSWLQLFLSKRIDCRIFQEKTVQQIITEIFSLYSGARFQLNLLKQHAPRRYWVQYNESDLNFFNRICQQEGLAYYFEHENGGHTLHIIDQADTVPNLTPSRKITLQSGTPDYDHFTNWQAYSHFETGQYTQAAYNYMTPSSSITAKVVTTSEVNQTPHVKEMESYSFSERYHNAEEGKEYITNISNGNVENSYTRSGSGDCRNLSEGKKIELELTSGSNLLQGQFADKGKIFTLTRVQMLVDEQAHTVSTSVEAVPETQLVYPACVYAQITGMQTAVVTGPAGEEIHTDQYGRIKVQFHWDRLGKQDENTTCWLRVMQNFAGPSFGGHFTPRIGHEVVVAFENGNPERPFVIGSLYHTEHLPPYADNHGSRAGIRTRSTKGGGVDNCNELYFEDLKGQEEVYFQAEKDHNVLVKNDQKIKVGHNKDQEIGKDETHKVGENLTIQAGRTVLIDAQTEIQLQVGGSVIQLTQSGINISSNGPINIDGKPVNINN